MKSEELYLSLDEPDNADHLWRYSPWKKIHPTGNIREIPREYKQPKIKLSYLDGSDVPSECSITKEESKRKITSHLLRADFGEIRAKTAFFYRMVKISVRG